MLLSISSLYGQTDYYRDKTSISSGDITFEILKSSSPNNYLISNRQNRQFGTPPKDKNGVEYQPITPVNILEDGTEERAIRIWPKAEMFSFSMLTRAVKNAFPESKLQELINAEGPGLDYLHKKGIKIYFIISPKNGGVLEVAFEIPKDIAFSSISPDILAAFERNIKSEVVWNVPKEFREVSHIPIQKDYFFSRTNYSTPR